MSRMLKTGICPLKSACKIMPVYRAGGFTLFEVMISISIVAIVFVSQFKMQSQTIRSAQSAAFHTTAPYLAQNTIAVVLPSLMEETRLNGDFGDDYPGYQWSADIKGYQTIDPDLIREAAQERFKQIKVMISKGEERFYLDTWRYVPDE